MSLCSANQIDLSLPPPHAGQIGPAAARRCGFLSLPWAAATLFRVLWYQYRVRKRAFKKVHDVAGASRDKVRRSLPATLVCLCGSLGRKAAFFRRMYRQDMRLWHLCAAAADRVAATGAGEVVLYGSGPPALMLAAACRRAGLTVNAVCPISPLKCVPHPRGVPAWDSSQLPSWRGPVLVGAAVNLEAHVEQLRQLGLAEDQIFVLPPATAVENEPEPVKRRLSAR